MRCQYRAKPQIVRLLHALLWVLFPLLALWVGCTCFPSCRAEPVTGETSAVAAVALAEEAEKAASRSAPLVFCQEAIDVSQYADVQVSADGTVIGFALPCAPEQAFESVAGQLESHDWVPIASGSPSVGSFMKQEGSYRWLMVSCFAVADQTSVVLQTIEPEED